jgi:hypothetical protein
MEDSVWKYLIIVTVVSLIILIILQHCQMMESSVETFGTPPKSTDSEDSSVNVDYQLDNSVGDVLLEWDLQDTTGLLDQGELEGVAVHTLKCSRSCCPSQWPLPRELRDKGNVCGRDLVRSNFSCGNGSESGCVCLPRKIRDMIARRGNNATWYDFDY